MSKKVKLHFSDPNKVNWILNIIEHYAKDSNIFTEDQFDELELLHYDLSKQLQKQTKVKKKKKGKKKEKII